MSFFISLNLCDEDLKITGEKNGFLGGDTFFFACPGRNKSKDSFVPLYVFSAFLNYVLSFLALE